MLGIKRYFGDDLIVSRKPLLLLFFLIFQMIFFNSILKCFAQCFLLVEMTENKTNCICTLDLRLKSGNISRYLFCNLDVLFEFSPRCSKFESH